MEFSGMLKVSCPVLSSPVQSSFHHQSVTRRLSQTPLLPQTTGNDFVQRFTILHPQTNDITMQGGGGFSAQNFSFSLSLSLSLSSSLSLCARAERMNAILAALSLHVAFLSLNTLEGHPVCVYPHTYMHKDSPHRVRGFACADCFQ